MKLSIIAGSSTDRQFILLAPSGAPLRGLFRHVDDDAEWHQELIADMQRLRGRIYLKDGAISEKELSSSGRHIQAIDAECWHLLIVKSNGFVVGCTRSVQHDWPTQFNRLRVRPAALARSARWSGPLRRSIER